MFAFLPFLKEVWDTRKPRNIGRIEKKTRKPTSRPWSPERPPPSVTPAKAGVQKWMNLLKSLDSRLRGNDDYVGKGSQSGWVRDQGLTLRPRVASAMASVQVFASRLSA